ncbi:MAG: BON domain-containing protein [Burkholderiales bacterium]
MNTTTPTLALIRNVAMAAALAGGFGLAQAAADAASAPVSTAVKKTERVMSDSWITTKVKSEITASSLTKGFKVHVKTLHGVVILKGKLASQDSIDQVKAMAEKVKGVKSVDASSVTVAAK